MKPNSIIKIVLISITSLLLSNFAVAETVDVLILYDKAVAKVKQGKDIPAKAASMIEYTNRTYKNSNVNIKLRTVHLQKIAVSNGRNVSNTALSNLARQQDIKRLREKYGADLVVLLTLRRNINGGYVCGIGYIPQGNGKLSAYAKFAGYSVTAVNCDNATFAHELGHNMALGHSYAQNSTGGIVKWGRGHGKNNNFATIMAYPQAYGKAVRVQQFSSPYQKKCKGLPCGVAHNKHNAADAVNSLNRVAKQVSAFYPTKVPNSTVTSKPKTKPKSKPKSTNLVNIVPDGDFDKLGSWKNYKGQSSLQLTKQRRTNQFGLKVFNRKSAYSGPVQTIQIETGKTYKFSAYAALITPSSARSTMRTTLVIHTNKGIIYKGIDSSSVVRSQWTKLDGAFRLPKSYGHVLNAELRFFGPSKDRGFLLDNVVIKAE